MPMDTAARRDAPWQELLGDLRRGFFQGALNVVVAARLTSLSPRP
jgi:hypothetical protein